MYIGHEVCHNHHNRKIAFIATVLDWNCLLITAVCACLGSFRSSQYHLEYEVMNSCTQVFSWFHKSILDMFPNSDLYCEGIMWMIGGFYSSELCVQHGGSSDDIKEYPDRLKKNFYMKITK